MHAAGVGRIMRPTVGIICEYDPFHRGHARQFALIRERLPDARIMCVMSGCFTQRGMPALFAPAFRARAALSAGASLVLELPCAFAVREAEHFALGGVSLLASLGFVTHLSFGCETADPAPLWRVATLLEQPTPAFHAALHAALSEGLPFAAAQARAAVAAFMEPATGSSFADGGENSGTPPKADATDSEDGGESIAALLSKPNNILAVCYLRALLRLGSGMQPLPVLRQGEYHAESLQAATYPSASAVRKAYLAGDLPAAEAACGYPLAGERCHRPEALDMALIHRLRTTGASALRDLPDCSEGLENRLLAAARVASTRTELLAQLKTRRYAYARLNRLATHAMLDVTSVMLAGNPLPTYARLLGFSQNDREALALLRKSGLPIVAKAADGDVAHPLYALDARAYDLWALGAGLPAGLMYRQSPVRG